MSLKKSVFDYMEKHPKTSLEQLIEAFSDQNRSTVRKYYYDFSTAAPVASKSKPKTTTRKKTGTKAAAKPAPQQGSTRQSVFDYLKSHPNATIDELCDAVSGASRKTIRDYRNKWLKANETGGEKTKTSQLSTRQKVYKYLNENPTANLNDLKQVFSNYKRLVTDFRSWKQKYSGSGTSSTAKGSVPVESDKQKIRVLTAIIEKQRETIEKQKIKIKQISNQLANSDRPGIKGLKKIVDRFLKK